MDRIDTLKLWFWVLLDVPLFSDRVDPILMNVLELPLASLLRLFVLPHQLLELLGLYFWIFPLQLFEQILVSVFHFFQECLSQ